MAKATPKKTANKTAEKKNASTETVDPLTAMMASGRKHYETDADLELKQGVDIEVANVGTFGILRMTTRNKAWTDAIRKRFAPHADSKDVEFRKQLEIAIFADTIVVRLKDVNGNVIPYDDKAKRAVKELLNATPDLYELLQLRSNDNATFLKAYEAEAKN